jgi:hypothetical protein
MAALRANTIQRTTNTNLKITSFKDSAIILTGFGPQYTGGAASVIFQEGETWITTRVNPRKNPIIAKGIAKMVCENRIKLR